MRKSMGIVHRQGTKLLWVVCLCLQLVACGALAETSGQISQQELAEQIEAGTAPLILDVRTAEEYEAGHIPGAINIHFRDINQYLEQLNLSANQPVVVYCEQGVRANIAEQTLETTGLDNILHLEGDISQWRQNNLPLTRSETSDKSELLQQSSLPPSTEYSTLTSALEKRWIVTSEEAKQLIGQGATLLDTRKVALTRLQDSTYVNWQQFSLEEESLRGKLLDNDDVLTQKLQSLGISQQMPVVVFANPPGGWGEDGRIVWMLRTLGHSKAVIVDGGFEALVKAGVPVQRGKRKTSQMGDFVVQRTNGWTIQRDELKEQLNKNNLVVLDTREEREFMGKTPYGEQRGGHVPGAIHFYFKDFLEPDGKLLPPDTIRMKLESVGITPGTQVVVYCTGGIRSGWMATVLATLGYQVKNYAGSMWEWSAGPETNYPLEIL